MNSTARKQILPILTLAAALLAASTNASAAPSASQFIRTPGQYPLDAKGSRLEIQDRGPDGWSLKVTWKNGNDSSGTTPENCLKAKGWFVFVELPDHIWVYFGRDSGILLAHSDKDVRVSAFSSEILTSCPQEFWKALPKNVKTKYPKTTSAQDPLVPAGSIDIVGLELSQFMPLYGSIADAELDTSELGKLSPVIIRFKNTNHMTRSEAIRLLDAVLYNQAGIVASHPDAKHVKFKYRSSTNEK